MKKLLLIFILFTSINNFAQATLFSDINKGNNSSNPSNKITFNGYTYFIANDGINGSELWRTDGTENGTTLFKEFVAGTENGMIAVTPFISNNKMFFFAIDNGNNYLWKTDGTVTGTEKIKQFSSIQAFHETINNELIFTAENGLWKTDGTEAGTVNLKSFSVFGTTRFVKSGNEIYFSAKENNSIGNELYKTDGTIAGTILVKNIYPGANKNSYPNNFTELNNTIYFSASNGTTGYELWKTDGTEAGTELVKDINPGSGSTFSTDTPIINFNNELYFIKGTTLWKSDGTNIGTVEVKDLEANVKRVLVFNSKLHIFNYGNSFWVSDGTNVGTTKIEVPINEFWHNGEFEVVNDKLFFQGNNDCGYEIWVTDGTANGTMLLKDIHPSFDDNNIEDIVELNGKAIFTASDSNWKKKEIYFSDGTKNGTSLLKDINKEGNNSSSPQNHFTFGNKVLFSADNGEFGRELWVIDGASTLMLKDINSGHLHSNPSNFIEFNGSVYFSASTKEKGKELWKTDGTKAGTVLIKDINPGTKDGLSTGDIVSLNNKMYFFGNNGNSGVELFESDGTEAGTKIVVNINNTSVNSISNVNELVVLNNELFFIANNGTSGSELFKSDGTEAGTVLVKDINTNGSSYAGNLNVHPYLNKLYFSAYNGSGTFLWESDGTSTNTYQQSVKNPSNFKLSGSRDIGDRAQSNIIYNTELYFSGESTSNFNKKGVELWAVTYSGTIQEVFDINPGTLSSSPANLTDHKGQLYFSAKTATNGKELWKAIGVSHAELVKDMISGTSNSNFLDIGSFGNNILFATGNNGSNLELWKSDGTEAGTILLQDINPSTEQYGNGSSPKNFFVHDNKLYFSANDSTVGEELWVLEESALSVKKENLNLFSKMSVYPNPTSETLNFKIDNQLIKSVRIYSILGKEVMKKTNKFGIENINITNLSSGLYLLQINTETGVFTKRIVKK